MAKTARTVYFNFSNINLQLSNIIQYFFLSSQIVVSMWIATHEGDPNEGM